MTRLGFYIIHNNRKKLVHTIDVPWDFALNEEDGSIKPNPIPPSEEVIEGFSWNDRIAENVILYIRNKVFWIPENDPYILRYATFIISFTLAEKLGVIDIEDKEKIEDRPYLKNYEDINSVFYINNEEMNDDEVRVVTERKDIVFNFEGQYPDFNDEEINKNENEIFILSDNKNEIISSSLYSVNEEILNDFLNELQNFKEGKFQIYMTFEKGFSSGLLEKKTEKESNSEDFNYIYSYKENKIIFFKGEDIKDKNGKILYNKNDILWILPLLPEGSSIKVIFRDNNLEVENIVIGNNNDNGEEDDEIKENKEKDKKFIIWFRKYFYNKLIKDKNFLNYFNTERTYYIISQENERIMGLMTIYKGRTVLIFKNHNYKDLIEKSFPLIRDDMIFKDESFGGFEEDPDYLQDIKLPIDEPFGGFEVDEGFLV